MRTTALNQQGEAICKPRLQATICDVGELTPGDRDDMFALMSRHYENVERGRFDTDLEEKQWIIRLIDSESGALRGFSTQMLLTTCVSERPVRALFSGDTIVDPRHWGSSALAIAWGKLVFSVVQQYSGEELYWFLISQGYRTYRFLPVYFREFYPRFDAPTPPRVQHVIDVLGAEKFAESYDPSLGVVRSSRHSYRVRTELGEVTSARLKDPHVRCFVDHNPGYGVGDELCCLAPLSYENFSRAARRLIQSDRFSSQTIV